MPHRITIQPFYENSSRTRTAAQLQKSSTRKPPPRRGNSTTPPKPQPPCKNRAQRRLCSGRRVEKRPQSSPIKIRDPVGSTARQECGLLPAKMSRSCQGKSESEKKRTE